MEKETEEIMGTQLERNMTFAYLQVIGILLVISDHMALTFSFLDYLFPINSFHMSLFMFISGYFYSSKRGIFEQIKRKTLHLLIPYYVYVIVFFFICAFLGHFGKCQWGSYELSFHEYLIRPFIYSDMFSVNSATWFIIALYSVSVVYILIDRLLIKN